jgi:hypothetical protein
MFDKLKVKKTRGKIEKTSISLAEFNASAIKAKMDFLAKRSTKKVNGEFVMKIVEQQLEEFTKLSKNGRTIRRKIAELKNIPNNKFLVEIKGIRDGLTALMQSYHKVLEKEHHDLVHNNYQSFSANFKQEKKISKKAESTLQLLKVKVAELEALKKKNKLNVGHGKGAIYGTESLVLAASMIGQAGYVHDNVLKDIARGVVALFFIILLWKIFWPFYLMMGVVGGVMIYVGSK